jgi:hypothetical protein
LLRSRFLRGVAVGVLLTLLTLAGGGLYLWSLALSDECEELQRADLSIDELVAIKRRVDAYRRDPSSTLHLTGREASFLLREQWRYPVFVSLEGEQMRVQATIPDDRGCYNVHFQGHVSVDDGVAAVRATHLDVGELDLTGWIAERSFEVQPADLSGPHASFLLDQMTLLEVADGQVAVQVEDPKALK